MPGGDGTGPGGMGPMTGRGAGFCAGYGMPGYMNPMVGGGGFWGMGGRGGGRGRRNQFYATGMTGWQRAGYGMPAWGQYPAAAPVAPMAPAAGYGVPPMAPAAGYGVPPVAPWAQPTREQEVEGLKGQAEYFEDMLDGIKKRIEELEAQPADDASTS